MKRSYSSYIRVFLIFLCVIAFFIRIYGLFSSIQFDSDFGRDSLFALRILHGKLTLLGAQASVGGFYLGPLYFYAIALCYRVFGFVPEIISLLFVVLAVFTLLLGFHVQRKYGSYSAGIVFALLFMFQPLLVSASRGATHQPMLSIVVVLFVATLIKSLERPKTFWSIVTGVSFGLFLHLHFSALLLFPGYVVSILVYGEKKIWAKVWQTCMHMFGVFLMASPLLLFDLRHGFINSRAFLSYILLSARGGGIVSTLPHWTLAEKTEKVLQFIGGNIWTQGAILIAVGLGLITIWKQRKKARSHTSYTYAGVLTILTSSVLGLLMIYKGYLFSYYLIVPCTVVLLFVSFMIGHVSKIKLMMSGVVLLILVQWIPKLFPLYSPTYRTLSNLTRVVHAIEQDIDVRGIKRFTIFKDSSDGMTGLGYEYRFLLERDGYIPVSEYRYQDADVLYVIREEGEKDPINLPHWEVTQFGPKYAKRLETLMVTNKSITLFLLSK
ncbi:MAG: glycosyltransferase family 39 protein [Candidatus Pacebacteria bacterium]|nr:glycosyltransferase family 39 protein [Candidatus Paceibacterota bacterium]